MTYGFMILSGKLTEDLSLPLQNLSCFQLVVLKLVNSYSTAHLQQVFILIGRIILNSASELERDKYSDFEKAYVKGTTKTLFASKEFGRLAIQRCVDRMSDKKSPVVKSS